jgi:hypothetical protein
VAQPPHCVIGPLCSTPVLLHSRHHATVTGCRPSTQATQEPHLLFADSRCAMCACQALAPYCRSSSRFRSLRAVPEVSNHRTPRPGLQQAGLEPARSAPVVLVLQLTVRVLQRRPPRRDVVAPVQRRRIQPVTRGVHLRLWLARTHPRILLLEQGVCLRPHRFWLPDRLCMRLSRNERPLASAASASHLKVEVVWRRQLGQILGRPLAAVLQLRRGRAQCALVESPPQRAGHR